MNTKKIIGLFGAVCIAANFGFAQATVTIEGNVEIKDNPYTPDMVEGNLRVHESVAIGNLASATGLYSIASGAKAQAPGYCSVALGGGANSSGSNSVSIGQNSVSDNHYTIAIGNIAKAMGFRSTAIGFRSEALHSYATAVGQYAIASGYDSSAYGVYAEARERESFAVGYGAVAAAYGAHSFGCKSVANGRYSFAAGIGVTTETFRQTTLGTFNAPLSGSPNAWVESEALLVVGNGETEEAPSNAIVVKKSGDTTFYGEVRVMSAAGGISMGEFAPVE